MLRMFRVAAMPRDSSVKSSAAAAVISSSNELDFVVGICYYRVVLRKENQMAQLALLVTVIICAFIFVVFVKSQQFAHARAQAEAERQKKAKKNVIVVYVDSETGEVIGTGKEA